LRKFEGRYSLDEVAVGTTEGEVQFGWEPTGRYGGVGQSTGNYITVQCRSARKIIEDVVRRHGRIDILKVDIETMEEIVIGDISALADHIRQIYVEYHFASNPLFETHVLSRRGSISKFSHRIP
ncbi:MAG: FkbM family methyltransferase, partial [Rhodanobacter sp.]